MRISIKRIKKEIDRFNKDLNEDDKNEIVDRVLDFEEVIKNEADLTRRVYKLVDEYLN